MRKTRQPSEPNVKVFSMALEGQLLPPAADVCQKCATKHEPELPHNQQSLFWQCWFYRQNAGARWPTWADAMAHCTPEMRETWTKLLRERGVEVPA